MEGAKPRRSTAMLIDLLRTKGAFSIAASRSQPPQAPSMVAPGRPARSEYDELALMGIGTPRDERRPMPDQAGGSLMTRASTSPAGSARETHGELQLVRKPSDWTAGSRASLLRHGPTSTVFEIFARPDLGPDDALTLQDFRAALVHGGAAAPPDVDLEVLCGEAVLMALFLIGLAGPVVVNPIDGTCR
jgi:hypothetical protein